MPRRPVAARAISPPRCDAQPVKHIAQSDHPRPQPCRRQTRIASSNVNVTTPLNPRNRIRIRQRRRRPDVSLGFVCERVASSRFASSSAGQAVKPRPLRCRASHCRASAKSIRKRCFGERRRERVTRPRSNRCRRIIHRRGRAAKARSMIDARSPTPSLIRMPASLSAGSRCITKPPADPGTVIPPSRRPDLRCAAPRPAA